MGSVAQIPVVDLSAFTTDGDQDARRRAAADLAEKTRINGCVGVTGYGIPAEELKQAFATAKRFFDLPYDEKMKAPHPDGLVPHRGYSGPGKEQGAASLALDTADPAKKQEYADTKDYKVRGSLRRSVLHQLTCA
jgi:isopenicillin N synthase-like dioxygenase